MEPNCTWQQPSFATPCLHQFRHRSTSSRAADVALFPSLIRAGGSIQFCCSLPWLRDVSMGHDGGVSAGGCGNCASSISPWPKRYGTSTQLVELLWDKSWPCLCDRGCFKLPLWRPSNLGEGRLMKLPSQDMAQHNITQHPG